MVHIVLDLFKRLEDGQESVREADEENMNEGNVQLIPADRTPKLQETTDTSKSAVRKIRNNVFIIIRSWSVLRCLKKPHDYSRTLRYIKSLGLQADFHLLF